MSVVFNPPKGHFKEMLSSREYDELVWECSVCGCHTYQESNGDWWIIPNDGSPNKRSTRKNEGVIR